MLLSMVKKSVTKSVNAWRGVACVCVCVLQLIHFVNRDSEGLARDFVMLDFIPVGTDLEPVARELRLSFGDEGTKVQMDFQVSESFLFTFPCIIYQDRKI